MKRVSMKRAGMAAAGIVIVGSLAACSSAQETAFAALLDTPVASADALPPDAGAQLELQHDTVRLAGRDSAGRGYFVGTDAEGTPCLAVVAEGGLWGASCGRLGQFSMEFDGVIAWLGAEHYAEHSATESFQGAVFIATPKPRPIGG
ncbi:hypothetical protein ACFSWE_11655 [Leucobacter albus]|uniref:META domain-containing protein n=1 Tax=Leucobacter albus TaxID=272210 RepID=A0ABW3TQG0_9MICO